MWIRRTLAALGLALVMSACGQHQTQRTAVASYLQRVNRIETELTVPLGTVTTTGNEFAEEQKAGGTLTNLVSASHRQALLNALSRIVVLRARLASIKTPPPAAKLRQLLLEIIDGQAALTREVAQLVVFLPRFDAGLAPLVPATRQLESALAQQTPAASAGTAYAEKAAALRRFKAAIDATLRRIAALQPPAVSTPAFRTEVKSLRGMSSSAGQLADSLANGPLANVQQLLLQFNQAAVSNQTLAAQKAQIAAVRAYDNQSVRLQKLTEAAELERLHLDYTLK